MSKLKDLISLCKQRKQGIVRDEFKLIVEFMSKFLTLSSAELRILTDQIADMRLNGDDP